MEPNRLYFFTATIHKWIPILRKDELKQIILNSLRFLVSEQAVRLSAFVIMPNHIHLMLMPLSNPKYKNVQLSLMRFTGQKIKHYLQDHQDPDLQKFLVNLKDRKYQFWQRNPMAVELYTRSVAEQKLDYIHSNPVMGKWELSETDLDYHYSSIKFYEESEDCWPFITHYKDLIQNLLVSNTNKGFESNGQISELYNLIEDPGESNDIINLHPEIARKMHNELRSAIQQEMGL